MDTLETIRQILGWCTLLNFGMIFLAGLLTTALRGPVARMHGGMFAISEEQLSQEWYHWLGNYKIAIFVFNLMPYLAPTIVS